MKTVYTFCPLCRKTRLCCFKGRKVQCLTCQGFFETSEENPKSVDALEKMVRNEEKGWAKALGESLIPIRLGLIKNKHKTDLIHLLLVRETTLINFMNNPTTAPNSFPEQTVPAPVPAPVPEPDAQMQIQKEWAKTKILAETKEELKEEANQANRELMQRNTELELELKNLRWVLHLMEGRKKFPDIEAKLSEAAQIIEETKIIVRGGKSTPPVGEGDGEASK